MRIRVVLEIEGAVAVFEDSVRRGEGCVGVWVIEVN